MASPLTYIDFAAVCPQLSTSDADTRAIIEGFINQAELVVPVNLFGTTIPARATRSKGDTAVLLYAGHLYRHYLRALSTQGEQAVGQVVSIQDNAGGRSYAPIAGNSSTNSASDQWLATTPEGLAYLGLRAGLARISMPLVACD